MADGLPGASPASVVAAGSGQAFISARCPQRWTRAASQRSFGVSFAMQSTAAAATRGLSDCFSSPQRAFAKLPQPPSIVGRPSGGHSPMAVATVSSQAGAGGGGGGGAELTTGGGADATARGGSGTGS